MQEINFGKIEKLLVQGGEPVLNPAPKIIKEIKFGGENGPKRELEVEDFALKAQVVELFSYLTVLDNAVVASIDIRHGLPFRMNVVEGI
jgi:hypothetical protein